MYSVPRIEPDLWIGSYTGNILIGKDLMKFLGLNGNYFKDSLLQYVAQVHS